ncbi:hypothetical protein HXX76_011089 [Chlamydomonas incerta]|uniref:Uncharacterized protein n=1 Tax=Chlamydomonas incerta TaxID=51695 RepID=A0A835SLD8_CHLIN|nr:hypothetical protein HXX76_011089 [Chlamydomonas incerta]|eukprot:KAG2429322.1 hypothetical protein HXX76_011089 [Chlamydomonas incerta]
MAPGSGASATAAGGGDNTVAEAFALCSRLDPDQLTQVLKRLYDAAGPDRALSLRALHKRGVGVGALTPTTRAALVEGCLVSEQRQVLLELLRQDVSRDLRCSVQAALLRVASSPPASGSAAAAAAAAAVAADAGIDVAAAAAAAAAVPVPPADCAGFERRVQQLSGEQLAAVMMEGPWLRQLMQRLQPHLKSGDWDTAVAAAGRISPTLREVLRRTPCPAVAPLHHTAQAVAGLLLSGGRPRATPHLWPLTSLRISKLLQRCGYYSCLVQEPDITHSQQLQQLQPRPQLLDRLPKAALERLLLEYIRGAHAHHQPASRTALLPDAGHGAAEASTHDDAQEQQEAAAAAAARPQEAASPGSGGGSRMRTTVLVLGGSLVLVTAGVQAARWYCYGRKQ